MVQSMTIGQLAARTGLSVRTLRFYADAGVLPRRPAARRATAYSIQTVCRARGWCAPCASWA
jgi:hypothetical protein